MELQCMFCKKKVQILTFSYNDYFFRNVTKKSSFSTSFYMKLMYNYRDAKAYQLHYGLEIG